VNHCNHQKHYSAGSSERNLYNAVLSIAVDVAVGLGFKGSEAWTAADWCNCRAWATIHADDVKSEKARRWAIIICAAQTPVDVPEINEASTAAEIGAVAAAAEEEVLTESDSIQGQSSNKESGSDTGNHQKLLSAIRRGLTLNRHQETSSPMDTITSSPGCAYVSDPVEATVDEELGLRPHPKIDLIHEVQPSKKVEEKAALEAYLLAFRNMHAARLTVARAMRFQAVALVHHATLKLGYSHAAALSYAVAWLPLGSTVRERTEAEAQAAFALETGNKEEQAKTEGGAAEKAAAEVSRNAAKAESTNETPRTVTAKQGALLLKYANMLRVQVPRGAVAVRMLNEGCDPALLDSVLPPQTAAEAMSGAKEKPLELRLPAYSAGPVPLKADVAFAVLSGIETKSIEAVNFTATSEKVAQSHDSTSALIATGKDVDAAGSATNLVSSSKEACALVVYQRCVECCVDVDAKEKSVAASSKGELFPRGTKENALRAAWEAAQQVSEENASTTAPGTAPATTAGTFSSGRRQEILSALRNHGAAPKPPPCLELAMAKERARRWVALHSPLNENVTNDVENGTTDEEEGTSANVGVLVAVEAAVDAQLCRDASASASSTAPASARNNNEANRSRHVSFMNRGILSGASASGGGGGGRMEGRAANGDSAYTAPQRLYLAAFKEHWPRVESLMAQCRAHRWEVLAAQVYHYVDDKSTKAVQARAEDAPTLSLPASFSAAAALAVDSTCAPPENAWAWAEAWCLPRGHSGINPAAATAAAAETPTNDEKAIGTTTTSASTVNADVGDSNVLAAAGITTVAPEASTCMKGTQLQQAEARTYLEAWRSHSPEAAAAEAREKVARLCAFAWPLQRRQNPFGSAPERSSSSGPNRVLASAYGQSDLAGNLEADLASFHFYGNNEVAIDDADSRASHEGGEWACEACTLLNPILAVNCRLCITPRPLLVPPPPLETLFSKLPRPVGVTESSAKASDVAETSSFDTDPSLAASDKRDAAVVAVALDLEEGLLYAQCCALSETDASLAGTSSGASSILLAGEAGSTSVMAASVGSRSSVSPSALVREVELCVAAWRSAHPAGP
jgi:hypothetical protein